MTPCPLVDCEDDWYEPKFSVPEKGRHQSFFDLTSKKLSYEELGFKELLLLRLKIVRRDLELGRFYLARNCAADLFEIEQWIQKELWF